jgi:hypothetical protein
MSIDFDIVNKTTSIIAKRASGKSVLLRYLVEQNRDKFERIICFCPTESISKFYSKGDPPLVDKNFVFAEWSEDYCRDLCDKLTKINANKSKAEMKMVLLILDDIFADTDFHHSPILRSIFMRSRHYGLAIISAVQYLHNLPPICRTNSDWVLTGQMNRQSVNLLADEFSNIPRDEFITLVSKATKDYGFLVINNNAVQDNENIDAIYGVLKTPKEFVT